jgi:hypothetical protein
MKQLLTLFPCVLILLATGCGQKLPDGMPPLHPTTLTFTQGGVPLADAGVTLFAQEPANAQWSLGGTTDSRGMLRVQTQGFNGAPAGNFKIVVSKVETEDTGERIEITDHDAPRPTTNNSKSFYLVDAKYRSVGTTDLTLEVKAGKNAETFDLGTAVREEIPVYRD